MTYMLKTLTVINSDNIVNLVLNGGTVNYITRLANVAKTSNNPFYNVTTFTCKDISLSLSLDNDACLVYVSNSVPVYIENVTVINRGSGRIFNNNIDAETNKDYNGNYYLEQYTTSEFNGRYTSSVGTFSKSYGFKRRDSMKLINATLILQEAATIDSNTQFVLYNEDNNNLYTFIVPAGSYDTGSTFNGTVATTTYNLISRSPINMAIHSSTPTGSTNANFICQLQYAIGEMQPRASVLISTTSESTVITDI